MTPIRPCPCCGSEAIWQVRGVLCTHRTCGLELDAMRWEGKKRPTIAAWNRRVSHDVYDPAGAQAKIQNATWYGRTPP